MELVEALLADPQVQSDARARELAVVLTVATGKTSTGWPYLQEPAWVRFRDWVPHILADGEATLRAVERVERAAAAVGARVEDAAQVVRQVVLTASVTAPPDLWLLRHVLAACATTGLSERLLRGEALRPEAARAQDGAVLRAEELAIDLRFLLSRGLLQLTASGGYRLADHAAARAAFAHVAPQEGAHDDALPPLVRAPGRFAPGAREIVIGARLVPLVLALRVQGAVPGLLARGRVATSDLAPHGGARALQTLEAAGVVEDGAVEEGALTTVGRRVLERGPGPFGIIEAYRAYLERLPEIWRSGRSQVWVERGANVAASQDANRQTFEKANDALDRFCKDTGFSYRVFIEHALGKGEATRQRAARSGAASLTWVGADLEDAAIDAAMKERDAGVLPRDMLFVRHADIGKPAVLLDALGKHGIDPAGAVMVVGNGFHEVREQSDARMIEVLRGYAEAGVVMLFTEETGLSVEDLLHTAWNTYHAGFKYVHERSGQGLRPAERAPASALEGARPLSWAECAARAGYVRLDAYSPRGRTVYPYTPPSGVNPAISVTHFCVPQRLAAALGLA